jgi:tetratricopeptide (TPR) repeat protein
MESLLAESLYEPLDAEGQKTLDGALAADEAFFNEAQSLRRLRDSVRLETPEFTGDLVPLLHARLLEAAPPRGTVLSWRWISGITVATAAAAVLFVSVMGVPGMGSGLNDNKTGVPTTLAASPVKEAIAKANSLMASRDLAGARVVLDQALAGTAQDPAAGEAQQLLANLEFSEFHRYPEAYAAYDRLRTRYPAAFMGSPESIQRFNLLDEARRADYSPMHALDAIRNHPGNAFEQCERLVAQYPDSLVASMAMNEMRAMVGLPGQLDGGSQVMALERVRNRCCDPVAVAQVTLALGNAFRDDLRDTARARLFYNEAASSGHTAVAARAQEALAKLAVDAP